MTGAEGHRVQLPVDDAQRERLRAIYKTPIGLLTDEQDAEMTAFMSIATDDEIEKVLGDL